MALVPIAGTLLILATAMHGSPGGGDCASISPTYEDAVAAVADASRAYQDCVAASRGRDDCTAEYDDLDLAAARFEAVVGDFAKVCRQGGEKR